MSRCPDCRNEFVQPFVCATCGAQKLYDVTLRSAQDEIERLRNLLAETLPHIRGNIGEWRMLLHRPGLHTDAYEAASQSIVDGNALLVRIDAALGDKP